MTVIQTEPEIPARAQGASVAIITLGCGRNEVDSDQLAGLLHRTGHDVTDDPESAEVVIVNTCTFIAPAKQESIDTVLEACQLKHDARARAVVIVGCMAQRYPDELAEAIPEADAVVGFDGYTRLGEVIGQVLDGTLPARVVGVGPAHPGSRPSLSLPVVSTTSTRASSAESPAVATQDDLDRIPASGPRFVMRAHDGRPWAYLKIASGCDRVCTFCAIPSFRGRFRSRPLDEIVVEAQQLAGSGVRELVLVSENTTSWGKDLPGGRSLQPRLLRALGDVDAIERVRLMYLQPAELTDELLEAMAGEPKVASYFDLSLQHVSGPVVERMARSGDHERFGALIERIRGLDPDAVFRSNFIVGFPGETDADARRLEDFLLEHRLDWVGLFAYSPEDGTPAMDMPGQVPEDVARDRLNHLSEIQERVADDGARRFVGRDLEVIVQERGEATLARSYREAPDTDGEIELRTPGHGPADLPVGRTLTVRVADAVGVDLIAHVDAGSAGPEGTRARA
ncbi:MAG: 30S ribosomal protein S12 methylthiotransferase RimO [Nitriliruptoraceae bacterium]